MSSEHGHVDAGSGTARRAVTSGKPDNLDTLKKPETGQHLAGQDG
jgi:hypothetical protein